MNPKRFLRSKTHTFPVGKHCSSFTASTPSVCLVSGTLHQKPVGVACPHKYFREADQRFFDPDRNIRSQAFAHYFYVQEHYPQLYFYHWIFNLDKYFTLNLTFQYIYFSSTNINECYFSNLTVFDCEKQRNSSVTWRRKESQYTFPISTSIFNFSFCGIHSKAVIYSRCSDVAVVTQLQHYVLHDTKLSYSLVDFQTIVSISFVSTSNLTRLIKYYIWDNDRAAHVLLEVYRVSVHKFQTITGAFSKDFSAEIHDGPGILSPLLRFSHRNSKKNEFRTSSFSCVIFLLIRHNFKTAFTYLAKDPSPEEVHVVQVLSSGKILNFPGCQNFQKPHFCLLNFTTHPGSKINLSVIDMKYSGQENTANCLYAGISAYENNTGFSTICVKPDHMLENSPFRDDIFKHQTAYSTQSHALVAMYSCELYGNISFVLIASATKCRAVQVNVCEGNNSKVHFDFFHTQTGDFTTSIKEEECQILQLGYGSHKTAHPDRRLSWAQEDWFIVTSNPVEKCQLGLHVTDETQKQRKIRLHATGFLRGKIANDHEREKAPTFQNIETNMLFFVDVQASLTISWCMEFHPGFVTKRCTDRATEPGKGVTLKGNPSANNVCLKLVRDKGLIWQDITV